MLLFPLNEVFNGIVSHSYIALTIVFQVASQLIMKWRMSSIELDQGASIQGKFLFAIGMLSDPFIIISIVLTLFSGLSWMLAMTKFDISYAYPFTALGFVIILASSHFLFGEEIVMTKIIGVSFIVLGIYIISREM
jgi:multidrug transporter EmrE-like cation transporter